MTAWHSLDAGLRCLKLNWRWLEGELTVNCSSGPDEAVVDAAKVYAG